MEKIKNMGISLFFIQNIWSIQKKAVILQPISELTNQKPRWRNR